MDFLYSENFIFFCNFTAIAVCFFNKIPQILTLYRTRSVSGLSLNGVIVELLGYTISMSYNVVQGYPISSYVEYYFLISQDIFLILFIFHLVGQLDTNKVSAVGMFLAVFYGFTLGIPHPHTLHVLIRLVAPIVASSKLIHLRALWTSRNSESVSILSWLISTYVCAARLFTTYVMTADPSLLTNYFVGFALNICIVASAILFKNPKKLEPKKE